MKPAILLALLSLALRGAGADTRAEEPPPSGLWDVVRVSVDPADQPRWTWRPDDPRLLGRALHLQAEASTLLFDADIRCPLQRWVSRGTTLAALLRSAYPRPPAPGRAAAPTAAEMGLRDAPSRRVTEWQPRCAPDAQGRVPAPWDDTWIVSLDPGHLLMRHDQALLHLTRRAEGARPQPSFACAKAGHPSERALCADVELAAWDRSVTQAWNAALRRQPDAAALRKEQSDWLAERNRCQADRACLRERMRERVEALVPQ